MKKIIPAILTKNVADLKSNLGRLQGLTDWAQVDIMDGKFVNNISVSLDDVNRANIYKNLSLEAHLMVENPEKYFKQCQKGNIKRVIFHIEAAKDLKKLLDDIAGLGMQRGLALKPGTSINEIEPYIDSVDVILLMSVEPGFQGQKFIETTLDKIKALKKMAPNIAIEVDGGINLGNIKNISEAGADYLILGSALMNSGDIEENFKKLNEKIN